MSNIQKLRLDEINILAGTQARAKTDDATVGEYKLSLEQGVEFPPVIVFADGSEGGRWLADGFHRYHAHRAAGLAEIRCDVRAGTYRDAKLFSFGANATHGLPRSAADKKRAVEEMLDDPEWSTWTQMQIAAACHVSREYVSRVSTSRKPSCDRSQDTVRDVTRNGATYQMDTAKIGKPAAPAPAPAAQPPFAPPVEPATVSQPCVSAGAGPVPAEDILDLGVSAAASAGSASIAQFIDGLDDGHVPDLEELNSALEGKNEALREEITELKAQVAALGSTDQGARIEALLRELHEARSLATSHHNDFLKANDQVVKFDKLLRYGLDHGIMQAQNPRADRNNPIQIVSLATLKDAPLDVNLLVIDECHVLPTSLKKRLTQRRGERGCFTIGLTATPFTKGLGKYFDHVINAATTNQLIAEKRLVPFRVFAASEPDMTGAEVSNTGEWVEREVESRSLPIIGDVIQGYKQHGQDKKFIAFASSVAHAEELQRQFMMAGVICGLYTYRQTDDEQVAAVAEFRKPDSYIRGLISIESLTRGFDVPDIEVLIMARPLRKALAIHIQMLGRVLRCSESTGKHEAIVLDHSGNCMRFWTDVQHFFENGIDELDGGKPKEAVAPPKKAEKKPVKCPVCFHVHDAAPACPSCGAAYEKSAVIEKVAGVLKEVKGKKPAPSVDDKKEFYSGLRFVAESKGWSLGWASHKFKDKFGDWPDTEMKATPAAEPSKKVRGWVTSRHIAENHAKKKAAGA
ncbi:helicase-related protein [Massilia frigida]|nr:helicase-related protein [Massilia frigida]